MSSGPISQRKMCSMKSLVILSGQKSGSVTIAGSTPVSNSTNPSGCSITYTLIGSGTHSFERKTHQYAGLRVPYTCSG